MHSIHSIHHTRPVISKQTWDPRDYIVPVPWSETIRYAFFVTSDFLKSVIEIKIKQFQWTNCIDNYRLMRRSFSIDLSLARSDFCRPILYRVTMFRLACGLHAGYVLSRWTRVEFIGCPELAPKRELRNERFPVNEIDLKENFIIQTSETRDSTSLLLLASYNVSICPFRTKCFLT